jgi:hypothetical protein
MTIIVAFDKLNGFIKYDLECDAAMKKPAKRRKPKFPVRKKKKTKRRH